jgi:hypothetical protein
MLLRILWNIGEKQALWWGFKFNDGATNITTIVSKSTPSGQLISENLQWSTRSRCLLDFNRTE